MTRSRLASSAADLFRWAALMRSRLAACRVRRSRGVRSRLLAPLLLLLLTVIGCTGTEEESIPVILVVGSVEPGGPQLQLFEDVRDPTAVPARDLVPVPGSVRALSAPPVSFDVVDRTGERSELVVLTEDGVLHFFDLTDLPGGFAASRTALNVEDLVPAEEAAGTSFCWEQVQVGGEPPNEGRFAALLDSCAPETTEIYVFDLLTDDFLYALSREHVIVSSLLPAGIYIDQRSGRLFFPVGDIADTEVRWLPVEGADETQVLGETAVDPSAAVDLAPLGNGIGILSGEALGIVPFEGDPPAPIDLDLSGAETLLPDPTGSVELLAAFSDTRGLLVEGFDVLEAEPLFLQEPLADVTLEPIQRFAYLLEEGGIEILDMFPYADPPADRLLFFDLPGLEDPLLITWTFGSQAP